MAFGIDDAVAAGSTLITGVIDRIWPNPNEQDKNRIEALKVGIGSILAIHATNQEEAKNPSIFVAGWRPAVGWICVCGLAYGFLLQPLLAWGAAIAGQPTPPVLDLTQLFTIMTGMLGLSVQRMVEGLNGKKRTTWPK